MTEKASSYLKSYPFDVVYIISGVNDITNKDRQTGRVSFLWKTEEALTNYLIETRREGFRQLRKDHPGATVVFCPLVGLDFSFFFFLFRYLFWQIISIRRFSLISQCHWEHSVTAKAVQVMQNTGKFSTSHRYWCSSSGKTIQDKTN